MSSAKVVAPWKRTVRRTLTAGLLVVLLGLAGLVADEMHTSRQQADWLTARTRHLSFQVEPGPSNAIRFAGDGPYDQRLGYHQLPQLVERLRSQGFEVTAQARMSPAMLRLRDEGLFATYHEKTQAGLSVQDCRGESLYEASYPERTYASFGTAPSLLVKALLYIENRDLLDPPVTRNPAVEWDRLGKAVFDQLVRRVDESHNAAGGSTLATQIEKYRHSPQGRTDSARDKLRQMASASLRAYIDGQDTTARRRQIVLDYLNTVPLSAQTGFGEVNGLGDGLWAWYGRDFDEVNQLLAAPTAEPAAGEPPRTALAFKQALLPRQALAFKQALSLMVAQRRPSHYLGGDGERALEELTNSHLRLLADAGVITPALRDAALPLALRQLQRPPPEPPVSYIDRKAATAVRGKLQQMLDMPRAYDLDRLDLSVDSSLASDTQRAATTLLRSLNNPESARAAGLYGFRLLKEGDDPSKITFSFTLFERAEGANLLRVQTDNLDQPFDLNEGARLDLGSTAKLRTLVTYLEQVAELHERWNGLPAQQLAELDLPEHDAIGRWARDHLRDTPDRNLTAMLNAALDRTYSANPDEGFFTGGGLHHFDNFEPEDDSRTMTVREALTRSVNLVFIRLMRDIVRHVMADRADMNAALLGDPTDPARQAYLSRFADKEGRTFIIRFYRQFTGKSRAEMEEALLNDVRPTPTRLASLYYGLEPEGDEAGLAQFLARHLDNPPESTAALHEKYQTGRWSLPDRGYLAGVHPLAMWVAGYLRQHPQATLTQTLEASTQQRQEAYGWLFKTRHKSAQDSRIRNQLELEAFAEVHKAWKRLGYPFESLTPSYATALGASGDRPAALAELMGLIVNRGQALPQVRVNSLQFATATPYETRLAYRPSANSGERVMKPEVADVVREALIGVVENGTAKRLKGALTLHDGSVVPIGGKTGTGDHRYEVYGAGGKLVSSRVVNRSATLAFLIGDRYFGTLMAYVHGPDAERYKFTSAMPSQLLKALLPSLQALVEGSECVKAPPVVTAANSD